MSRPQGIDAGLLLANKVVVVTGASRGIGAAITACVLDSGASVLAVSRTGGGPDRPRCANVAIDLCDEGAPQEIVARTVDEFGTIDGLVNNAGIIHHADCWAHADAEWDAIFETNLTAPFRLSQQVVAYWLDHDRPGAIVNIASVESEIAMPRQAGYAASKGGLLGLTRAMAVGFAPVGVRVVALAPGDIDTDMPSDASVLSRIPAGRRGTPNEVGSLAAFILSDHASYLTGAMVPVDGGFLAQ